MAASILEEYASLFSTFIRHVGPTFKRLVVSMSEFGYTSESLEFYKQFDISSCVHITSLVIGVINVDRQRDVLEDAMWSIVNSLPSSRRINDLTLFFDIGRDFQEYHWMDLVQRLEHSMPFLDQIKFKIGAHRVSKESMETHLTGSHFEELHDTYKNGKIVFEACEWVDDAVSLDRVSWQYFQLSS